MRGDVQGMKSPQVQAPKSEKPFGPWTRAVFLAFLFSGGLAFGQGFSFTALRETGSGLPNNIFTYGDRVVPIAQVESNVWYKIIVRDSSGTVLNPGFFCTPGSTFATNDNG